MFGKYFKHVLALTLLAAFTYSLPQVKDAMAGAFDIGYAEASAYTAAAGDLGKASVASQVSIQSMSAKVSYDSRRNESGVLVTAKVKITGGQSGIAIPEKGAFAFLFTNKIVNGATRIVYLPVIASNLTKDSTGTYNIKPNTTASFTVSGLAGTASMIAGQYTVSLIAVSTTEIKLPVPTNRTNTFIIIGENSPYISLVGSGLYGTQDTLILNTVRLGRNPTISFQLNNQVCPVGQTCPVSQIKTYPLRGNQNSKQVKFSLAENNIVAGSYSIFVTNTELGSVAGKSNEVYALILDQSKILTAKVIPGKLGLTYDSNNQEASLAAQFEVTIKAGDQSLSIDSNSFAVSGASNVVLKSVNGVVNTISTYTLPAGKEARFLISASNNPKTMFAGQYTMSVVGVYPIGSSGNKVYVQVNKNETNAVTIVGEVSPYINSVNPNPALANNKLVISGQKLQNSFVFIDGAQFTGEYTISTDGNNLTFLFPSTIADGYHMLYVKNANGQSNNFWFQSTGYVSPYSVSVLTPNGGQHYKVGDQIAINVAITNPDQSPVALSLAKVGQETDVIGISGDLVGNTLTWTIPNTVTSANDYVIRAIIYKCSTPIDPNTTTIVCTVAASDVSDAGFSIVAPVTLGNITATIDPASPIDRTVQISNSTVTSNVVLGVFDLKSQGSNSTLQSLKINMDAYGGWSGNQPNTLFTNIKIKVGSLTYSQTSSTPTPVGENGVKFNFDNIIVPLPADTSIPVTVLGDVAMNTNGILSSSTAQIYLYPNQTNINAIDANYNNVPVTASAVLTSGKAFFVSGPITPPSLPFIQVLAPNGGEALVKGSHYQIRWNSNIATSSTVHLGIKRCPSCFDDINFDAPNTGSYDWIVGLTPFYPPVDQPGYQIKIVGGDYRGSADDTSDGYFTISNGTPIVTNTSAVVGTAVTNSSGIVAYPVTFGFSINNLGTNAIYLSSGSAANIASTSITGSAIANLASVSVNPGSSAGDTSTRYIIAPGASRTFSLMGLLSKSTSAGLSVFKVMSLMYGTDVVNINSSITTGLENLSASVIF